MASCAPVEAPEGTAARPTSPPSRLTSTSTVGFPRESRISRATMSMISVMAGALYAPSGSAGKDRERPAFPPARWRAAAALSPRTVCTTDPHRGSRSGCPDLVNVPEVDDHDAALRLLVAAILVAAAHGALAVVRGRQGQLDRRSLGLVVPPIPAADLVDDEAVEHSRCLPGGHATRVPSTLIVMPESPPASVAPGGLISCATLHVS